jgi:hypothetical protein
VCEERQAAGRFDLIGDPVPVTDALQGDRSTFREVLQQGLDGAGLIINTGLTTELAMLIEHRELRITAMGIATHPIMRHGCTSSFSCVLTRHECRGRCSAFTQSTR